MKVVKVLLLVCVVFAVAVISYLGYLGMFKKVTVVEKPIDAFWIVYDKHVGAYKDVGPIMDTIYYSLKNDYGIETTKGVGLYYDNPQNVPAEQCRSLVGCILEESDVFRIPELKKRFMVRQYPASNCATIEFPFKAKLSIFLGIIKAYPVLSKYLQENNVPMGPSIEIYDTPGKMITYAMSTNVEISKLESFLEPEPVVPEQVPSDSTETDTATTVE